MIDLDAEIRLSGRDLPRRNTECRAPRAWRIHPTPGGAHWASGATRSVTAMDGPRTIQEHVKRGPPTR